jgi:hypothetical protein
VPAVKKGPRKPSGALGLTYMADDFDAPLTWTCSSTRMSSSGGTRRIPVWPLRLDAVRDPENRVIGSAVSIWEIAIKRKIGKLSFTRDVLKAIA